MLEEILLSWRAYFNAHRFIRKHHLWGWIIATGMIYTLLFLTSVYLFWQSCSMATGWIIDQTGVIQWLQQIQASSWLHYLIVLIQLFIQLLVMIYYFSFFKYLFLIVGSPFLAYLSEKTHAILTNTEVPFSITQWLQDAWRGVLINLRNLFWQSVYLIALLLLTFIPVAGWISPLFLFFIDAYYMGFSMLDYSHERRGLPVSKSIHLIGRHRGLALGNGLFFYLLHLIPILGWMVAPTYAVVAATLSLKEAEDKQLIQY
ncbi:MAG: EI24 domain-containing protein [Ferruginibacter sp.]